MAENEKGRRRANGLALTQTICKSHHSFKVTDTALDGFRQEQIDIVGLIAARSGVAAATVQAHLTAFGLGARS